MSVPPVEPAKRADQAWQDVADLLTPAKSLDRNDKAKAAATTRITTTVTVVGTLLTGLGVLAAGQPTLSGSARVLVAVAVAVAAIAVSCVLAAQLTDRRKRIATNNLLEVQAWYQRQFDTGRYTTTIGTVAVLIAALLAGAAAILSLTSRNTQPSIVITQTVNMNDNQSNVTSTQMTNITVVATFHNLLAGQVADITISEPHRLLASSAITPAVDGNGTSTLTANRIPATETVTIRAVAPHRHCQAVIRPGEDYPALTCGDN
jgi:MFS family permease